MDNAKSIFVATAFTIVLMFASTTSISEECQVRNETQVTCECSGNEEFYLPEGYNYENITSLHLSSCPFANLHFSSLTEASRIENIVVQNISERLIFELFLTSSRMKKFELSNIRKIPVIKHDTFRYLASIERFEIRNVEIDDFEEQFTDMEISEFFMANVTISRIEGFNLSGKERSLRIVNCEFRNVSKSLNFAYFSDVVIANSKFELQKAGHVLIEGEHVLIKESVFSNVSMNLVAAESITINAVCADGKSSLRLSAKRIESFNNKLPTEIVYTKNKLQNKSEFFVNRNNTVCIAGNCKCPKSSGQSSSRLLIFHFVHLLLFALLSHSLTGY